jgi:Coenzyme PQQ synthesis protein D (PqqD)
MADRTHSMVEAIDILPEARHDGVEVVTLDDELVVYDTKRNRAHALNRTSAAVWQVCDGHTTIAEARLHVAQTLGAEVSEQTIWEAVRQLDQAALVGGTENHRRRITRRQAVKAGIGTAVLLPAVTSIVIPTSRAAAASPPPP